MAAGNSEKRREKRRSSKLTIIISYPSQDGSGVLESHSCNSQDISVGGLKLMARRPLPLDCILPLQVKAVESSMTFQFEGEIKWCLEVDEAPTYYVGIKLLKILKKSDEDWQCFMNQL